MSGRDAPEPLVRMVLKDARSGSLHRVVLIEEDRWAWLADLGERSWPEPRALPLLRQQVASGAMVVEVDPFAREAVTAPTDVERHSDRSEARWTSIEPLVRGEGHSAIMRPGSRLGLMKGRATEAATSYQNLVKLLRRYWARGMTPAALVVNYRRCGGPGKRRELGSLKPGRPRTKTEGEGIAITVEERRKLHVAATYHLDGDMTQKQALEKVIAQFYATVVEGGSARRSVEVSRAIPTIGQFRYYLKTHFTENEVLRRRKGRHAFDLEDRALPGKADDGVQGPGSCFELDATVADTFLVSSFDRTRIVGRPVIYLVVDVWSRLIVGLYVGFEGPSWLGAVSALVNAVTPKVDFCRSFGVEIEGSEWPSRHLPSAVIGDRGEMISIKNAQNLEKYHNVRIVNVKRGRGDLKGIVERRFGIVQSKFKAFIPGYVKPDFGSRGADDYRKDAVLTLEEFTRIMILAVVQHNRTPPRKRAKPAGMVAEGLTGTPAAMWAWGVRNRSGALQVADVDAVALSLLPTAAARVTARGVKLFGTHYSSEEVALLGWFTEARRREFAHEVSYDPRCLDAVYLWDPRLRAGYSRLELRRDDPWRGKSLAEVEENEGVAAATEAAAVHGRLEEDVATQLTIEEVIASAKEETSAARDGRRPTAKDIRGIRDNKEAEKTRRRKDEALRPGLSQARAAAPPEPADDDEDEAVPSAVAVETKLQRLMRLRAEREAREEREGGE